MHRDLVTILLLVLLASSTDSSGLYLSVPLAILAMYIPAVILRNHSQQKRTDFINQLKSCRNELRSGGTVVVDGMLLRYSSVLTSYQLPVGGLISNVDILTPFREKKDGDNAEGILLSILALATGWWSVPYGPLVTFLAISNNLVGGQQISVAMLIDSKLIERLQFLDSLDGAPEKKERLEEDIVIKRDKVDTGPGSPSTSQLENNKEATWLETLEKPFAMFENSEQHERTKQRIRNISTQHFKRFSQQ
jgi:hypothetical protein